MITPNLLRGEQVRLTAPTAADLPAITRWWADLDFLRLYNTAPAAPRNEDQLSRRETWKTSMTYSAPVRTRSG